jgi:two-component system heavy metal sensor histidine kinase CusS
VQGDRLMLRRALSNLLSNAMRYTAAGQTVSVSLEASSHDKVLIRITNPSAAVSPEHLPKLFDRFYRADPSRQHKGDGAGLGLAIVKSIIEAHEGSISANWADGQMRFTLELPSAAGA